MSALAWVADPDNPTCTVLVNPAGAVHAWVLDKGSHALWYLPDKKGSGYASGASPVFSAQAAAERRLAELSA